MPSRHRKRKAKLKAIYVENKEEILAKWRSEEAKAKARSLYKKKSDSEVKRDDERRKYRKNRERLLDAKLKFYHKHAETERAAKRKLYRKHAEARRAFMRKLYRKNAEARRAGSYTELISRHIPAYIFLDLLGHTHSETCAKSMSNGRNVHVAQKPNYQLLQKCRIESIIALLYLRTIYTLFTCFLHH